MPPRLRRREGGIGMELTVPMVLIAAVGVFIASVMDAIAGGGGIISIPAYLLAGLPMHAALGTNKLSSSLGLLASAGRYIKNGYVRWKLAVPSIVMALLGSACGTRLQLLIEEKYLQYLLIVVLPLVALVVLRKRSFPEETLPMPEGKRTAIVLAASLIVGAYDGFYGPGTGTFLLILFTGAAKLDVRSATGNVKLVNLASGVASLIVAAIYGDVQWILGLICAAAAFAGQFIGAGLTIKNGSKIVRPIVVAALVLLTVKVIIDLI